MVEDHWSVCVGGVNKSFQCSGPVPGRAAKAQWEEKRGLAPGNGRFPVHSEDEDRFTGPLLPCRRGVKNLGWR
jgi:hypothetical protein